MSSLIHPSCWPRTDAKSGFTSEPMTELHVLARPVCSNVGAPECSADARVGGAGTARALASCSLTPLALARFSLGLVVFSPVEDHVTWLPASYSQWPCLAKCGNPQAGSYPYTEAMELTGSLLEWVTKPTFLFRSQSSSALCLCTTTDISSWDRSPVNPKNLIECLDSAKCAWRIDGATTYGTQFYIVPVDPAWDLVPLRVDLFIPSQEHHPAEVRGALQSSLSVCLRDPRGIANLGISRHLCRALEQHSLRDPGFLEQYRKLPFGSKLAFEDVAIDLNRMHLSIYPAYDLERQLKTASTLRAEMAWVTADGAWRESIDLFQLRLVRQLHDSVSLVRIENNGASSEQQFIFKSCTADPQFLYHELKFLLTCPPHDNILSPVLFLVTKKSSFGGKRGVCGFIIPYLPLGSIRDVLPYRRRRETMSFQHQIKWSRQIASALQHIHRTRQKFYSDLRPDNVLLRHCPSNPSSEDAILIDFEQRGNWYEWCPPEILYRTYLDKLQPYIPSMTPQQKQRWEDYTKRYLSTPAAIAHTSHGGNAPWFSLSATAQEKASVYCLGLLLYCIFEGVSNVRVTLSNAYPNEPDVSFPDFKRTPHIMQRCINRCTIGAPEWTTRDGGRGFARKGDGLYPANLGAGVERPEDTAKEIFDSANRYWSGELKRAEEFFTAGLNESESAADQRPTLWQILQELEGIERVGPQ